MQLRMQKTSLLDAIQRVVGVVAPQPATQAMGFTRRRLPDEREAITKKFSVAGHEGYVTVGMYDDGTPGELFIVMSKEGSTISGLMDGFATAVSLALQYGVPLPVSILDYIFRWLALKFLPAEDRPASPARGFDKMTAYAPLSEARISRTIKRTPAQQKRRTRQM